jgi:hypothetical protein
MQRWHRRTGRHASGLPCLLTRGEVGGVQTWESCRFFDHYTTGDARAVCKCVPNGDQAAVVIKRGAIDPEKIRIAEQRHPQTAFIQLSKMHPPLCNAVARAYAKLRLEARGDEAGKELHPVATTGLAAVLAALALCDKVS